MLTLSRMERAGLEMRGGLTNIEWRKRKMCSQNSAAAAVADIDDDD